MVLKQQSPGIHASEFIFVAGARALPRKYLAGFSRNSWEVCLAREMKVYENNVVRHSGRSFLEADP